MTVFGIRHGGGGRGVTHRMPVSKHGVLVLLTLLVVHVVHRRWRGAQGGGQRSGGIGAVGGVCPTQRDVRHGRRGIELTGVRLRLAALLLQQDELLKPLLHGGRRHRGVLVLVLLLQLVQLLLLSQLSFLSFSLLLLHLLLQLQVVLRCMTMYQRNTFQLERVTTPFNDNIPESFHGAVSRAARLAFAAAAGSAARAIAAAVAVAV